MRKFIAMAAAVLGLGVVGLAAAPPALATVTCNGTATNVSVPDSIVVPTGATCILRGVGVGGNITVQRRGQLKTQAWNGRPTQILGGISVDRGYVELTEGTSVGAAVNIRPRAVGNPRVGAICGSTLSGNLDVRNAPAAGKRFDIGGAACGDGGNTVNGNVSVVDNKVKVRIVGNSIGGNLSCAGNDPPPEGSGNTVTGLRLGQCVGF